MAEALIRPGPSCISYHALRPNSCSSRIEKATSNAVPHSNFSQARVRRGALNASERENLCKSSIRAHLEPRQSEAADLPGNRCKQVAGRLLTGALTIALTLMPAADVEAYAASSAVHLPLAAAVQETPKAEYAADLFAQLKGYTNAAAEQAATTKNAVPDKVSKEDPVTAAIESIKVGEKLDVPKVPEVAGPSISAIKERSTASEEPARVAEKAAQSGGGLIERLKKTTEEGRSGVEESLAASKQLFGRLKEGVTDKMGGQKGAPEPVQQAVEPQKTDGSKGWLGNWTGAKETEDKKVDQAPGNFLSRGLQTAQSAAKQSTEIFQPKPPPKEETGLAGAWQSFTRLEFLPDNIRGGAITVKSVLSTILTVLSLVLSVLSKALGLAADLIGIIARGL